MPTLTVDGGDLLVRPSPLERLSAFHFRDVRFPLASVTDVVVEPNEEQAQVICRAQRGP